MRRKLLSAAVLAAVYPVLHAASAKAAISDYYGSYTGYFSDEEGIVTSVLNVAATTTTFTVGDGSGSVIAYAIPKTTYTPTVGDDIEFDAYNAGYQGAPELVTGNAANGVFNIERVDSTGNPVTPYILTIPQAKTAGSGVTTANNQDAVAPYSESIVTVDNVMFNSSYASLSTSANTAYYINDGAGNGIELYDYKSDSAVLAAVTAADAANPGGYGGNTYNITAYADVYYGVTELYPISITQVAAVPEPTSLALLGVGAVGLLGRRRKSC